VARVRVEYVGAGAAGGSDDRQLVATLRPARPAPAPSWCGGIRRAVRAGGESGRALRGDIPIPRAAYSRTPRGHGVDQCDLGNAASSRARSSGRGSIIARGVL